MTDARPTPLHDEHVALGATLVPFAGWAMPLRYSSDVAEHTAVRTAAGLFDLSHMGEISVEGPDAGAFLDYALVGALTAEREMGARYTMICAADGGVLDDLIVYRLTDHRVSLDRVDGRYLVVANAANYDVVLAALRERATGFDVTLGDDSAATALVAVQGPAALAIVEALDGLVTDPDAPQGSTHGAADALSATGPTPATLKYYACLSASYRGTDVLLARTGYTGEDGFEFFVPASAAVDLWRALLAAGKDHGLVPAGLSARDSLRLEAGMPLYGHELDRTTNPQDAGLGRVVRLDKTDAEGKPLRFVGREALESRAHSPGARRLVGLQGLGRRAARAGYPVLASAEPGAPQIGHVTSGVPSPTLGYPIAMAYVTPERSAEGTELAVDVRGRPEPVRIVPLPFYRRPR